MDGYKYGYTLKDWDKVKKEIKEILRGVAGKGATITYSDLSGAIKSACVRPDSYELRDWLGEVSKTEDAAGRGMLSAVVIRSKEGIPGKGFFRLAKELKRNISDPIACWSKEVDRVHNSYAYMS